MLKLSSIFSDWMVLQRDTADNLVWGYSDPDTAVRIYLSDNNMNNVFETEKRSDNDGYFEIQLPCISASDGYTLKISDDNDERIFSEIAFGDVFVCGGQSNMEITLVRMLERYEDELTPLVDKKIRFFRVPEKFNFHHTEDMIFSGQWEYTRMPELLDFGAVAFFTAREISEKEGVTVGIINTAIGGTPVKAWVSEETTRRLGLHVEEFEECQNDDWVKETWDSCVNKDIRWREEAEEAFSTDYSNNIKGTFNVPGFFDGTPLGGRYMACHFEKEIELGDGWDQQDIKLYLGAIIDSDKVYVNGTFVGETGYLYPPRIYRVNKGVFKKGRNKIEIKFLVFRERGGFMPGMNYKLKRADGEEISLEGQWDYQLVKEMPYLPNLTFFSYKATGVFNGMIYPLRRQKHKGFFFYQGESNVEEYPTYKDEFEACIKDWRKVWKDDTLPFMFVQIACFSDGYQECGDKRCYLTEQQRKCLEMPYTAMIQAYDLGEFNELHPTNKKEVGRRCAMAALDLVYGKTKYTAGPEAESIKWNNDENQVEVLFEKSTELILSHGIGAFFDDDRDEENVRGFYYINKADGKRCPAEAELIDRNKVIIKLPSDVEVEAVSYAWADSCLEANLYNKDRLPVVPFYSKRIK